MMMQRASIRRPCVGFAAIVALVIAFSSAALADDTQSAAGQSIVSHGLTVYLGVVPAAIARGIEKGHGDPTMHGGTALGKRAYHVMVAVFNSVTGERITDATVTAGVSRTGSEEKRQPLEPMTIANAATYGNFFEFPGDGMYRIRLTITRKETSRPVQIDFRYEHPSH